MKCYMSVAVGHQSLASLFMLKCKRNITWIMKTYYFDSGSLLPEEIEIA